MSRKLIFLLAAWLLSCAYLGVNLKRGWVPHDEGALGQSAERVLHGEVPHRDFADPYSGGLSYLDALGFLIFGVNLGALRFVLFAFFALWVPAVFLIAREFVDDWQAAAVTLIAVAWSVPNYSAAIPSWYNLFLATFGILALLRYVRRPSPVWLVVAGLCGGLSFVIKSVGLYYIAAALLFLVYREQDLARRVESAKRPTPVYLAFVMVVVACFVTALIRLVFFGGSVPSYLHFVLPGCLIAVLLVLREGDPSREQSKRRFAAFFKMAIPFGASAAAPILLLFAAYARLGAMKQLVDGLFVAPFRRVAGAHYEPSGIVVLCISAGVALLVVLVNRLWGWPRTVLSVATALGALIILLAAGERPSAYLLGWHGLQGSVPVLTALGVSGLLFSPAGSPSAAVRDQKVMLLLTGAALCSLVEFPFAAPIYFCYVAPLAVLAAVALISRWSSPPKLMIAVLGASYLVFAVALFRPSFLYAMDERHQRDNQTVPLDLPRASALRVSEATARAYEKLVAVVREHARGANVIASPDCPEVYFLSGLANRTPFLFEFLDDSQDYVRRMRPLLDDPMTKVVVVNEQPSFSVLYAALFELEVRKRFEQCETVGSFEVCWRP